MSIVYSIKNESKYFGYFGDSAPFFDINDVSH